MGTYAEGAPSWVDLASTDVDGARRFYEQLFGWTSQVAPEPEAGGYTTFSKDGKAVAAVGPMMGEGQPPSWTTYFATDDADTTTRRVEAAGGKVLLAPMDVMQYGRMAVYLDPAGAAFAVWQANEMGGAEIVGAPGSLSWNELMTRDPEGSKAFYPAVLGWQPRDVPYEDATYTVWEIGGTSAAGMMPMEGEMWPADLPSHWMVYFEVDDTDAVAAKAEELGGMVSVPPTDTPAGRFAVLSDAEGAFFSIIKSSPDFTP